MNLKDKESKSNESKKKILLVSFQREANDVFFCKETSSRIPMNSFENVRVKHGLL